MNGCHSFIQAYITILNPRHLKGAAVEGWLPRDPGAPGFRVCRQESVKVSDLCGQDSGFWIWEFRFRV